MPATSCATARTTTTRASTASTIRSSDGGGLTRITNAAGGTDVPIDYSPDGTRIVFGHFGPFRTCTKTSALYVVNVDGSRLHRITPWGFCDDDGSWSPGGTKIAFASGERLGRIYVVHPDGTGLMQIPVPVSGISGLGDVSWSPDGTKIAFILSTGRPGTGPRGCLHGERQRHRRPAGGLQSHLRPRSRLGLTPGHEQLEDPPVG
jgi:TolB protein